MQTNPATMSAAISTLTLIGALTVLSSQCHALTVWPKPQSQTTTADTFVLDSTAFTFTATGAGQSSPGALHAWCCCLLLVARYVPVPVPVPVQGQPGVFYDAMCAGHCVLHQCRYTCALPRTLRILF